MFSPTVTHVGAMFAFWTVVAQVKLVVRMRTWFWLNQCDLAFSFDIT